MSNIAASSVPPSSAGPATGTRDPALGAGSPSGAGKFQKLLQGLGANKSGHTTPDKQAAEGQDLTAVLLSLLAQLGITGFQPANTSGSTNVQAKQTSTPEFMAAVGSQAQQGAQVLQQLLSSAGSSGGSIAIDADQWNAIKTLIQQSNPALAGQLQCDAFLVALNKLLLLKTNSLSSAANESAGSKMVLQPSNNSTAGTTFNPASAPVNSTGMNGFQQAVQQAPVENQLASVAALAASAASGVPHLDNGSIAGSADSLPAGGTTVAATPKQMLAPLQNPGDSVKLKPSVSGVRTQLLAWKHQVNLATDTLQSNPQAKEIPTSVTAAAQTALGTSAADNLSGNNPTEANLRMSITDLPQQIQSLLVKNASLQAHGGSRVFRITLVPEGLGEIKVLVTGNSQQNQISVQFITDRTQTQDLLNSSLPALRSGLEAMGVHLNKVEVDSSGNSTAFLGNAGSSGFFGQQTGSNQQGFTGDSGRRRVQQLGDSPSVREQWSMMEELAGLNTGQINLTA
ncbi:MAG: hypothetical protein JWN30_1543 [Bacilli bacterium]|nr:hypothetical protein [Bacilli bacterium]